MPHGKGLRSWSRIHKWSSLACTAFLFLTCLSALPLIFHDEIEALTQERFVAASIDGPLLPLDHVVEAAGQSHPGSLVQYVFWPPGEPNLIHIGIAPDNSADPDKTSRLVLDGHTGAVLGSPHEDDAAMRFVLAVHSELLGGPAGTLVLGAVGLVVLISVISGAVLYAPFMRRIAFATIRTGRSSRTGWIDVHNLLGIVTVAWLLLVVGTGILNTLEKPLFALWRGQELPKLLAPYEGRPPPQRLASVQAAVATVRAVAPDDEITSVLFPYSRFNSPRHYLVWTKGRTVFTAHLFSANLVDAETGTLTARLPLPWYLRSIEIARPLHFGDYGGLPLKIIWAVLDIATIVVTGSGLYIWLAPRRVPEGRQAPAPETRGASGSRLRQTARQLWTAPLVLAALTIVGVTSALLGDGIWDVLSWMALSALAVIVAERYLRRRHSPR